MHPLGLVQLCIIASHFGMVLCLISCDFEDDLCGWSDVSNSSYTWRIHSGPTPDFTSGPQYDHTFMESYGHYVYTNGRRARRSSVASLESSISLSKNVTLTFWYHMHGNGIGRLSLVRRDDNTSRVLWHRQGRQKNRWLQASVTLEPGSFELVLESTVKHSYGNDIAVDDIQLLSEPQVVRTRPTFATRTTSAGGLQCDVIKPGVALQGSCDFEKGTCGYSSTSRFKWLRTNKQKGFLFHIPGDHGTGSGYYTYLALGLFSSNEGEKATMISPSLSTNTGACLSFAYIIQTQEVITVHVYAETSARRRLLTSLSKHDMKAWAVTNISLCATTNTKIIFDSMVEKYTAHVGLDDITITSGLCEVKYSLTTNRPNVTSTPTVPVYSSVPSSVLPPVSAVQPTSQTIASQPVHSQPTSQTISSQPVHSRPTSQTISSQPVHSRPTSQTISSQPTSYSTSSPPSLYLTSSQPLSSPISSHSTLSQPISSQPTSYFTSSQPALSQPSTYIASSQPLSSSISSQSTLSQPISSQTTSYSTSSQLSLYLTSSQSISSHYTLSQPISSHPTSYSTSSQPAPSQPSLYMSSSQTVSSHLSSQLISQSTIAQPISSESTACFASSQYLTLQPTSSHPLSSQATPLQPTPSYPLSSQLKSVQIVSSQIVSYSSAQPVSSQPASSYSASIPVSSYSTSSQTTVSYSSSQPVSYSTSSQPALSYSPSQPVSLQPISSQPALSYSTASQPALSYSSSQPISSQPTSSQHTVSYSSSQPVSSQPVSSYSTVAQPTVSYSSSQVQPVSSYTYSTSSQAETTTPYAEVSKQHGLSRQSVIVITVAVVVVVVVSAVAMIYFGYTRRKSQGSETTALQDKVTIELMSPVYVDSTHM